MGGHEGKVKGVTSFIYMLVNEGGWFFFGGVFRFSNLSVFRIVILKKVNFRFFFFMKNK